MEGNKEVKPLISIIMPAYNSEKYVEEAINSVLNQTYKMWELIIIDDCSEDNTLELIKNLYSEDQRIHIKKNEKNIGVSETRNKGISFALGNWIAFLDSDDLWEVSKLEKQILCAQYNNAEFIFTGSSYINEKGISFKGIFEVPAEIDYKKLRNHNVISCSSVLVKKIFFEEIKMENDDIHEDYAVWLRILRTGIPAFGVNEPLLRYRISSASKSGNKFKTVKMTYKVFRFLEINRVSSFYFMIRHIGNSLKKYNKIFNRKNSFTDI